MVGAIYHQLYDCVSQWRKGWGSVSPVTVSKPNPVEIGIWFYFFQRRNSSQVYWLFPLVFIFCIWFILFQFTNLRFRYVIRYNIRLFVIFKCLFYYLNCSPISTFLYSLGFSMLFFKSFITKYLQNVTLDFLSIGHSRKYWRISQYLWILQDNSHYYFLISHYSSITFYKQNKIWRHHKQPHRFLAFIPMFLSIIPLKSE